MIDMKEQARRNFRDETSRSGYSWGALKNFSDKILDEIKEGQTVTYSKALTIANDNNVGLMADSLSLTLSSKALKEKLDNAAALDNTPKPAALSQKQAPKAPSINMPAPSMGLGGNRNGVRRHRSSKSVAESITESNKASNEDDVV